MPVLPRVGKKIGKAHELAIDADRASKAAGEFRQVQKYPPAFSQMFPGVDSEIEEEKIEESATKQWYYKDDLGVEQVEFGNVPKYIIMELYVIGSIYSGNNFRLDRSLSI